MDLEKGDVAIPQKSAHDPIPGEFYRCVVGSTLAGLSLGNGDRDEMGICIEPRDAVTGLDYFKFYKWRSQPEGTPSGPGDLDLTVYGLRHWMRLAVNGNPTILDLLFVPKELRIIDGLLADAIRSLRETLISKRAADAYLGYLTAQRQRMLGERGGRRVTRPLNNYGYDSKYASHMVRLGFQGVQLLKEGWIDLPMRGEALEFCRAVKRGELELPKVIERTEALEAELVTLRATSPLPENPDFVRLNDFLHAAYKWSWVYGATK